MLERDGWRPALQPFAVAEALNRFVVVAGPAGGAGDEKLGFGVVADLETALQVCLGLYEIILRESGLGGLPVIPGPEVAAEQVRSERGNCQQTEPRQQGGAWSAEH